MKMCDRSCIKERRNQGNVRIIAEGGVVMRRQDGSDVMMMKVELMSDQDKEMLWGAAKRKSPDYYHLFIFFQRKMTITGNDERLTMLRDLSDLSG